MPCPRMHGCFPATVTPVRWRSTRRRAGLRCAESSKRKISRSITRSSFPFEVLEGPVQWYGQAMEDNDEHAFDLEIGIEAGWPARTTCCPPWRRRWPSTVDPEPPRQRNRRRRVVRAGRCASPRAGALEGVARAAGAAGGIPAKAAQETASAARAGRPPGRARIARCRTAAARWKRPKALPGFTTRLREAAARASDAIPPEGSRCELRPYQREGLRWLNALAEAGRRRRTRRRHGPGQDVQLITHLLSLKQSGALTQPALIVVPTSLIPNWQSEVARFAPTLAMC